MLNLPQTITKNDGSTVVYVYSAGGNKLRKLYTAGGTTTTTEYDNGIQYDNSTTNVAFIQTEEGRARHSGTTYTYEYDLKDHLGNTRVTLTPDPNDPTQQTAKILQENDYYAFGYGIQSMQQSVPSPKNEYLYNHKELQEETGLYDYGARFYDPVIGRWGSVDPLAEKMRRFSPYNYADDNPIRNIDPDGMESVSSDGGDDPPPTKPQNGFYGFRPMVYKVPGAEKTEGGFWGYSTGGVLTAKNGTFEANLTGFGGTYSWENTKSSAGGEANFSALKGTLSLQMGTDKLGYSDETKGGIFNGEVVAKGTFNLKDLSKPFGFSAELGAGGSVAKIEQSQTVSFLGFTYSHTKEAAFQSAEAKGKFGITFDKKSKTIVVEAGYNWGVEASKGNTYKVEINFAKLFPFNKK